MVEPCCNKQVISHDHKRNGYARENAPVVAVVVTNAAAASARRDEAMHAMQTINFDKTNLHRYIAQHGSTDQRKRWMQATAHLPHTAIRPFFLRLLKAASKWKPPTFSKYQ